MFVRQSGHRRRASAVAVIVAVLSLGAATCASEATASTRGSSAVPQAVVGTTGASTSTAYQINAAHDGHSADTSFALPQALAWSRDLGGPIQYPVIADGKVFVDVNHMPSGQYGTTVSAYDLQTGALDWGPVSIGGTYGFGALTYDNGRLFALNHDGTLYAFDGATGNSLWSIQLPGQYSFTSPPTAVAGVVYAGGAGSGGTLYAVNESDGVVRWTASVMNGDSSSPAIDASGVYVSYACEQAYSFTTAGALRWHHSTGCEGGGGRTDVLHDGQVYIRDDAGYTPAVLSETTGEQLSTYASTPAPAFDGSTMITLSSGTLRASRDDTGAVLWSRADAPYVTAPLVVNGYVVEGDSTGIVHVLNEANGTEAWHGSAGAAISAPDEHNANGLTGLAEAAGHLVVPAGSRLAVFSQATAPRAWFTSGPADGTTVGKSPAFGFSTNLAQPAYACRVDNAAASSCTSPLTLHNLADGTHTLSVQAHSGSTTTPWAQTSFVTDAVAPSVTVAVPAPFSLGSSLTFNWSATDARSGVASYDVRYRTAPLRSGFGGYQQPAALQGTTNPRATITASAGSTTCVSIRARDRVGNVSGWTPDVCQAVVSDDRALAAKGSWYRGVGTGFVAGTFSSSSKAGASLTLSGVRADRVAVVATTCPSCGKVTVAFPGMTATTINLASSTTGQVVVMLPKLRTVSVGALHLTVASTGKPVQIDAVGTSQS